MSIERGKELYLNGRDGQVYKGRDNSVVTVYAGDQSKGAHFNINYADKSKTVNPQRSSIPTPNIVHVEHAGNYLPSPPPASAPGGSYSAGALPAHARPMTAPGDELQQLPHSHTQPLTERPGSRLNALNRLPPAHRSPAHSKTPR